jgi:peptidoglycan hydrolase-like protein with peptidoglycan-binding domain
MLYWGGREHVQRFHRAAAIGQVQAAGALRAGHQPPPLVGSLALTGHARLSYQQGCLAALGYDLGPSGVDGQDGPATRAAVTAYQQAHGLVPDGKWGVLTEASVLAEMRARYPHV